jgi:aminopeptidase-like protein
MTNVSARIASPNIEDMHCWIERLFPICRSITGEGVRESLLILKEICQLSIHEVPSGTSCFDWTVPDEWNVRDAYVMDSKGNKVIDFAQHNLHLMGYSEPFNGTLSIDELRPHLYSREDLPEAIPYVTSYYSRHWGFCLAHNHLSSLGEGPFKVKIDSTLEPGFMTFGELLIPGETQQEILLSTNICHPSMANNELSGPVMLAHIARWLIDQKDRRFSYRLLWMPETIGAIYYLSRHLDHLRGNTIAGYQVVCVGGPGAFVYVPTRQNNTLVNRVSRHVLRHSGHEHEIQDYRYRGSDERQWNSPQVELPVGTLAKSKFEEYLEYHTSLDDLSFVTEDNLQKSLAVYQLCLTIFERNRFYRMRMPCEPKLDKLGIWSSIGGQMSTRDDMVQRVFALAGYLDGSNDLLTIADIHDMPVWDLYDLVDLFINENMIDEVVGETLENNLTATP